MLDLLKVYAHLNPMVILHLLHLTILLRDMVLQVQHLLLCNVVKRLNRVSLELYIVTIEHGLLLLLLKHRDHLLEHVQIHVVMFALLLHGFLLLLLLPLLPLPAAAAATGETLGAAAAGLHPRAMHRGGGRPAARRHHHRLRHGEIGLHFLEVSTPGRIGLRRRAANLRHVADSRPQLVLEGAGDGRDEEAQPQERAEHLHDQALAFGEHAPAPQADEEANRASSCTG
mmetsp:Transcript_7531/g.15814  ORF Transcript_7531/g.15814 Transcript_7531/m.15814 type:complete len:228 (+) Transcript_7531:1284-1967(+)